MCGIDAGCHLRCLFDKQGLRPHNSATGEPERDESRPSGSGSGTTSLCRIDLYL